MGTRLGLYSGQPAATSTELYEGPTDTITTVTYAEAYNTGAAVETLDLYFGSTQIAKGVTLMPHETVTLFPFLGAVLEATDTIDAVASTATTINVRIDGYQVSTA